MDLKIPTIKIDLHEDVNDDIIDEIHVDEVPKNRNRAHSIPDMVNDDKEISQEKRVKVQKARSLDEGIPASKKQERTDSSLKMNKLAKSSIRSIKLEGIDGKEADSQKQATTAKFKYNRGTSQDTGLVKRNSLPRLDVTGRGNGNVDALVSPLIMRRFRQNEKRMSINVLPQKGAKNLIEITALTRAKNSKILPTIKSSWISSDDTKASSSGDFSDHLSPSLARRNRLNLSDAKKQRNNEEKHQTKSRPRSHSLSVLVEKEDSQQSEIMDTNHKPSQHWQIARNHLIAKNMKLPDVVQLYRKHGIAGIAGMKKDSETLTMPNIHSINENIRRKTKSNYSSGKNEAFFGPEDSCEEVLYQNINHGISLEERLKAIEIKHGIMHENLEISDKKEGE